jgi:hypothetical protein
MCGAASNGVLQDMFGRKVMFFVGGAISAIGISGFWYIYDESDPL